MYKLGSVFRQRGHGDPGQALVEFSLSLVVLLLLLFAVIDGGRLLHGWLTLQGAAREGGRYAITGQYEQDCLSAVPACPDARVFSIKERVIRASTGISVDPRAGYNDPRYLRVEISGVNEDNIWVPEYAGRPGKPVMVRAVYHIPVVTPLLRPIAESVRLVGQVVVNNENYAQVNSSNTDIELADLPPPPPPRIPVADLQVELSAEPIVSLVGESILYTLRVSNNGPDEARGVQVIDDLPGDVTFQSVSPAGICSQTAGLVTCNAPDLPRGVYYDISILVAAPDVPPPAPGEVVNSANVSGSEDDDDLSNNDDTASTLVVLSELVADLEVVSKDDLPDPVVINQMLNYTILVRNNGISDATGVELIDRLAGNLVFDSATVIGGSDCSESGGTVLCQMGDIPVGESAVASINVFAPPTTGTVSNTASVSGDQVDPDERNNSNSEETTIQPEWSDLYVVKIDDPDPVLVGGEITYSIIAANNGPSDATNVQVVDSLPPDTRYVRVNSSQGSCSVADLLITCDLGTVRRGQEVNIELVAIPQRVGTYTNRVEITSDQTDPNSVNDVATTVTTAEPAVDMSIVKTAEPSTPPGVSAGAVLTYYLTVTNNGPSAATNVLVEDQLPVDTTFLGVSATKGTCLYSGAGVDCNLGNLAHREVVTVTIRAIPEQEGIVVNTATVSARQPDTRRANNTAEDTTTVLAPSSAFITLDPVCGHSGSLLTINGFNWPSNGNKDVQIYWNAIAARNLIGTVVDNGVIWSVDVDVPAGALNGSHTIIAERSGVTAEAIFTVPCPAPNLTISPLTLLDPEPIGLGEAFTIEAEISNIGNLDAVNQFFIGLYFDPPFAPGTTVTHIPQNYRVELVAISGLAVNESRTVRITADEGFGSSHGPGLHDIYMVVDSDPGPNGLIAESVEIDNVSPVLQLEVKSTNPPTPTPGPTPTATPEIIEHGSLIGQVFLVASGGLPLPQAGVEILVYDSSTGARDGRTFTDFEGSYFLANLNVGTKTVSACIIIDDVQYTYTAAGVEIVPGKITFKDLFLDEGICN